MTTPTTAHPARPRRGLVIAGAIAAALAVAVLASGGLALWADGQKDEAGFISTDAHRFSSSGTAALVSENMDVDLDGAEWLVDHDQFGNVRLAVSSESSSKPVFVGIGRTDDVREYLRDVSHRVVEDVSYSPFDADYTTKHGDRRPAPPANLGIWTESAVGTGEQTLRWNVEDGDWSIVVMNADGSPGVEADVAAGAKIPWLDDLGYGLLGGGALLGAGAVALLIAGLRRPRGPSPAPLAPAPTTA